MELDANIANIDISKLFDTKQLVKICAPMVRYSKLQFRNLVRNYDCDLCYTPMILADSFCKSEKARNNEFTTNLCDVPLVTQFAANTVHDFVGAANLVSPYCNGIDLNCGCPQTWAKQQGLGCSMLNSPEIIYDIVRQCRNQIVKPFTISVKMRILKDTKKTLEICQCLEKAGVSYLTVHGRTSSQLTGDIDIEPLKLIQELVKVPVVANGGVRTLDDCLELQKATNCKGIMVANGILTNPTIFTGTNVTTEDCIQNWLDICYNSTLTKDKFVEISKDTTKFRAFIPNKPYNLTFQCFHHHLVFMLEKVLPRRKRQIFNSLQKFDDVLNFIEKEFHLSPRLYNPEEFNKYTNLETCYEDRLCLYEDLKPLQESSEDDDLGIFRDYCKTDGAFFKNKTCSDDDEDIDCDWSDMFLENG